MSLFLLVLVIITIADLGLGLLVLLKNPKNPINLSFFFLVLSVTLWIVFNYLAENAQGELLLWNRLTFTAIIFLSPAFAYFGQSFGLKNIHIRIKEIIIFIFIPLSFALISLTPFIVVSFQKNDVTVDLTYGSGYIVFVLYFASFILYGVARLLGHYFSSLGIEKEQIKYLLTGMVLSIVFAVSTNLVYPIITGSNALSKFGPFGISFLIVASTYAIVRHRLMDVRLAIRVLVLKGFVYLALLIAYIFPVSIIYSVLKINLIPLISLILLVGFLSVVIYEPIKSYLSRATDSFLFQREYNRQELLKSLGKVITESIEMDDLVGKIRETLIETMRVSKVGFILKDNQTSAIWEFLDEFPELLVYDELRRRVDEEKNETKKEMMADARERMQERGLAVVVPIVASEGIIGMITLDEKKGGDAFTSTDLDALENLIFQAGVAVENALLYNETKAFNKKLQHEITVATRDLQERNRRLTILRRLDQITLNTLNFTDMAQKIVDVVSWEMGFHGATLIVLDEDEQHRQYLQAVAISDTPTYERVKKVLPRPLTEFKLMYDVDPSNYIVRSIKERRPLATSDLGHLYVPPLTADIIERMQTVGEISDVVVYPLSTKGRALGAIVFDLPIAYEKLSEDEKELMQTFMDEAGIAVDNARLYAQVEQRNKQLQVANKRLRELDQMKDELVSVASHELRTPMTAIKSYIWMALNKEKDNLNPNLAKYLDRAFQSSERMIALVNDMLSASRLEGNRVELHKEAMEIGPIIKRILSEYEITAAERGLKIKKPRIKKNLPPVYIDQSRFEEIIINLVGNSIKYSEKGSISVAIKEENRKSPQDIEGIDEYLWISVTDEGVGISEEDRPKLFKKFGKLEQGSFTKTAETGGTGLGLYITKGLVDLHGGEIWIDSEVGKGSTFSFSVKVAG